MNTVLMYCRDTCPYCIRAEALLTERGATIEKIRIDEQPEQRAVMMQRAGRHTVPQIFIGDTHVGGCDDLMALDRAGGLLPLLNTETAN